MLRAQSLVVPGRLEGVSVDLSPGRVTAIVGPNGAGKSTLLSALAGLIAGEVSLDGGPLGAMTPRERALAIGYLPQGGEVAWNPSVETLVRLGRLPHRTARDEDDRAVAEALAGVDLSAYAGRPVGTLSGGERARALLARVLAGDPGWVLADEPLASLDLAQARALLLHFRRLAQAGKGVALVLHDLAQAANHADHVVVLDRGRVAAAGAPEAALDPAVIARVWGVEARWLGEPGARALVW
ncbi:ABC transporter ATP-binding protein [Novosphingobium sp. Fuku2-ISO-50]|uniref:ABC transporter ATP-binding protein n=1 Tax=Novosphingobium sp. Fuku2-ISO-50 TaxID=1739114 RepID=UPI00076D6238|nr:ABC transporter ATP-binding protein [Novosphingobium sp. Fuku2-ISO-50]KUR74178.1 ferrichrome ABC transporter ATP-binding protein [Novosphingobium sp. Fuku2-ISO-50]